MSDTFTPINQYAAAFQTASARFSAACKAVDNGQAYEGHELFIEAASTFELAAAMTRNPAEKAKAARWVRSANRNAEAAWSFKG